MIRIIRNIGGYLRLLYAFARLSLMAQLEYRINFASGVLVELGWMLVKLIYVAVVYRAGVNIGILTPDHILLFVGTYTMMTGVYMLYYPDFTSLSGMVQNGELDMYLVKPVSSQFLVTLHRIDFSMFLPDFAAGVVMIAIGWQRAGLSVSAGAIGGFAFFSLCGCFLTYSLFLIPHLLSFWVISGGGINTIAAAIWDFNNMPQTIYGKWMQRIGTFILPVFVITNFPGLFLMGGLTPGMVIWGVVSPVLFFFIARAIWKLAVRSYSSASS